MSTLIEPPLTGTTESPRADGRRGGGVTGTAADTARGPASDAARSSRTGAVVPWAVFGALWLLFAGQAMVRWVAGSAFGSTSALGPDRFGGVSLVVLRVIEALSVAILLATLWVYLLAPLRRTRRLQLDGMIVIGAFCAVAIDPLINYFHYTFAWNEHAINLGTWLGAFPLHTGPGYGEGLVWAVPQYLYLGIGLGAIECLIIRRLRRRHPSITNVSAFTVSYLSMFLLDIVIEQLFLRAHVYGFPRTIHALTLFPGTQYQFPVYESLFVGVYATGFAALRMSAHDHPQGLSFVERGVERIRPGARTLVRLLAVAGFCAGWAAISYFLPWSWMSVNANSINHHLPSYMAPAGASPSVSGDLVTGPAPAAHT
jgi:hypothetical protein